MTRDKKYEDKCPSCNKEMLRRKRDIGKDCNPCFMSKIGFAYAEKRRANPSRKTSSEYSKTARKKQFELDPFKFRINRTLSQTKIRAKKYNVPHDITLEYLMNIFPSNNLCPVLGLPFEWGSKTHKDMSPSVDRMIPEKGYVMGNINFISYKANRIKCDANIEILEKLIKYMKS